MSESAKSIIKYFCDRFLQLEYYPASISSILDLPIEKLRNFNDKIVRELNNLKINAIRDIINLPYEDSEKLSKKKGFEPYIIQNAIIAATLISNAWTKRSEYLKKVQTKLVVAGLDFAGKTSLINRLFNNYNYLDMVNLEPTIGCNTEEYQSDWLKVVIWDLGGQKSNIEEYLQEPEKYFVHIDILIFVIDAQDDVRYEQATNYLSDIIDILGYLKESPFFIILMNKVDSDVVDDPDFQIKLEYITEKVTEIFIALDKNWNFEIIPTSLYSLYANEPEIVRSIKDIFIAREPEKKIVSTDDGGVGMSSEIESKLQNILDLNFRILDKIASEFSEIKRTLYQIIPHELSKSLISVPFEKVPLEYISKANENAQKSKIREIDGKNEKKKKKKTQQRKKKSAKKLTGPPKRLKISPQTKEHLLSIEEMEKISDNHISSTKESLTSPSNLPPVIKSSIDLNVPDSTNAKNPNMTPLKSPHLHPPPPPQTTKVPPNPVNLRREIISELKDIFVRKGIVSKRD